MKKIISPSVGIIVVHYGSVKETLNLLSSLNTLTYPDIKIYIVDNDPRYRLPKKLPVTKFPFEVLTSSTNTGWAGGANIGAKTAVKQGKKIITFLTSDLLITDSKIIKKLVKPIVDQRTEVTLPMVVYASNVERIWMIGGTISEKWLYVKHNHFNKLISEVNLKNITGDYGGIGTTITAEALQRINYWTEEYFLYFEDVDFYYKLAAHKIYPILVPAARLAHATSSVKEKSTKKMELISAFCFGRSGLMFAKKYLSLPFQLTALLGWLGYRTPLFTGGMLLQQHPKAIQAYLHGVWEGIRLLFFNQTIERSNDIMEKYRE